MLGKILRFHIEISIHGLHFVVGKSGGSHLETLSNDAGDEDRRSAVEQHGRH